VAAVTHKRTCGPRAPRGCGYRHLTPLSAQPVRVEVIACIHMARRQPGWRACERTGLPAITQEWHGGVETSACAVVEYLWRLGRHGQYWARDGTGSYATTLLQLATGLAPIMGWPVPDRMDDPFVAADFLKRHRASIQRWLDDLQVAGLVSHEPERNADGQWYRLRITLHPCPPIPAEILEAVVRRQRGWSRRERRRAARGRQRNLTAILRRARLTRAERRCRGIQRRRRAGAYQQAQQVAARAARAEHLSLLGPPGEPGTTSQDSETSQQDENDDRGISRERDCAKPATAERATQTTATEERQRHEPSLTPGLTALQTLLGRRYIGPDLATPDGRRWQVYHEVLADRGSQSAGQLEHRLRAQTRRREQLLAWTADELPDLWWFAELFVAITYEPWIAALPAGFRLAFLNNDRERATLTDATRRYARAAAAGALPHGLPANPVAGLAHWLIHHTRRQIDGPQRGLAADLEHFARFTRQARAYAKWTRANHAHYAAARARRRQDVAMLAAQINHKLAFRLQLGADAKLKRARDLLDSEYPAHQAAGRALYAAVDGEQRLADRDAALITGQHSGTSDATYIAACKYAERWGLPGPDQQRRQNVVNAAITTVECLRAPTLKAGATTPGSPGV
jgi:hypothetical protein